ncbi:MAG TPA: hypothetical protein VNW97_18885 [Candidatus Saccharimonadales bacterium]|jgi:CheY-like chemotaxis protein|nr:hypothetical protein [Candidatus Saccharimonadales bacterium]
MNEGMNQPQNPSRGKPRRRRRNFGSQSQGAQNGQTGQQGQPRSGGQGRNNRNNRNNRGPRRTTVFVGPMDHSYRNQGNGNGAGSIQGRYRTGQGAELQPLSAKEDGGAKIFAFVDDLFFLAKIQEVGRKLNVKVDFVKSEKDILAWALENPEEKPSLIIVDLNSNSIKPLSIITKLKSKFKKGTSVLGFVSHVQGDLKLKAQEAGCDAVMPRSAFSQNLPNLLRRHATADDVEDDFNKA